MDYNLEKFMKRVLLDFHRRIAMQGLSLRQFSDMSGISYETLKRLNNPTLKTVQRIDDALKILESR